MNIEEIPKAILEKYPEFVQISQALEAYRKGLPITALCQKCNQALEVTEVEATGTLWVRCSKGCTNFRARRAKNSKTDTSNT